MDHVIYSKEDTKWVCRDWMYDLEKVAGDGGEYDQTLGMEFSTD